MSFDTKIQVLVSPAPQIKAVVKPLVALTGQKECLAGIAISWFRTFSCYSHYEMDFQLFGVCCRRRSRQS